MNVSPQLLRDDVMAAEEHFSATLARLSPGVAAVGRRLFGRIATPNWALEWGLPRWLGETFGLSEKLVRDLILSNVYGMAYARLHDDLLDGQCADDWGLMVRLAPALDHAWLHQYRKLFDQSSSFWGYLAEYTTQWLRSDEAPSVSFARFTEEDFLRLAYSAAPVNLCCVAACLLADRADLIPTLTSAIDRMMVAVVLLDDAQDWLDDVAAGRYNAFVAYASELAQVPESREANESAVLREIYLGPAARPYFATIGDYLRQALSMGRPAGCAALDQHLSWLAELSDACSQQMAQEAEARLRRAVEQVWRLPIGEQPAPGDLQGIPQHG